jgi:hypothetical protein
MRRKTTSATEGIRVQKKQVEGDPIIERETIALKAKVPIVYSMIAGTIDDTSVDVRAVVAASTSFQTFIP